MRATFCCFLLDERSHALTSYFGDQKALDSDVSLKIGHRQIAGSLVMTVTNQLTTTVSTLH